MNTPTFKEGDRVLVKGNCNYSVEQKKLVGKVVTVTYLCSLWFDFTCPGYEEGIGTVFSQDYDKVELIKEGPMKQQFKVGDLVQVVKRNLDGESRTNGVEWQPEMDRFDRMVSLVRETGIGKSGSYRLEGTPWAWASDWIEPYGTVALTISSFDSGLDFYDTKKIKQLSKPTKKEGFIMNITKQLKDLTLSKGDRLLRTYGIVDDCGDITTDGTEVLLQMLLENYKEPLIAKVTELDKEQKAKK